MRDWRSLLEVKDFEFDGPWTISSQLETAIDIAKKRCVDEKIGYRVFRLEHICNVSPQITAIADFSLNKCTPCRTHSYFL